MSHNFLIIYILLYIFIICDANTDSNPISCNHEDNGVCCEGGYKYINNYCIKIRNINNDKLYFNMYQIYYVILFIIIGIYNIIH